jgi:hypothetical protein
VCGDGGFEEGGKCITPGFHTALSARPLDSYPVWTGYNGLDRALHELNSRAAQAVFERFLADRDDRVAIVTAFLRDAAGIEPSADEAGIAQIEAWLWPWLEHLIRQNAVEPEQHSGLLHDIGVFAGDALIAERGGVEWQLVTKGPRNRLWYHFPAVAPLPEDHDDPFWAVTGETVADGYVLGNQILDTTRPPFRPRLLLRYQLFSGSRPWPSPVF